MYDLLLFRQLYNQLLLINGRKRMLCSSDDPSARLPSKAQTQRVGHLFMNPFDKDYKAQLSFRDLETDRKRSYQASRVLNDKRKTGVEPYPSLASRVGAFEGINPRKVTVEMPKMKKSRR
jgi:hypothetical protein